MTHDEQLRNLITSDIFAVSNMAAHYDVDVPDDIVEFQLEWFDFGPNDVTSYSFEELQELAEETLKLLDENPAVCKEPTVQLPIRQLKKMIGKTYEEVKKDRASQIELWSDSRNIGSMGINAFLSKHGSSEEFLEARRVIEAMLGSF